MPWIIEYQMVLEQMRSQGFKCNYYNSGAFAFADATSVRTVAWVGPDDPSIKPAALPFVRPVAAPHEENLARMATAVWQRHLPGRAWVMPMSHWAFELSHGSREWMPALVEGLEVDPGLLDGRNNAAAIEFGPDEADRFEHFVARLLMLLSGSDFMLAFPGRQTLCTLHHHKQLWWMTTEEAVADAVEQLAAGTTSA